MRDNFFLVVMAMPLFFFLLTHSFSCSFVNRLSSII